MPHQPQLTTVRIPGKRRTPFQKRQQVVPHEPASPATQNPMRFSILWSRGYELL